MSTLLLGEALVPASSSYAYYAIAAGDALSLAWPFTHAAGSHDTAAAWIDVAAGAGIDAAVLMLPPGGDTTPGMVLTITNIGAGTLDIATVSGASIVTVAPSLATVLLLTGNATRDGTWRPVHMGATTSSADASALEGPGLDAIAGQLAVDFPVVPFAGIRPVAAGDRATVLSQSGGGSATLNLPDAEVVGNGFFFFLHGGSSGTTTIAAAPGQSIDTQPSIVLEAGSTCMVVSTGLTWITLFHGAPGGGGGGVAHASRTIDVSGAGTYVENAVEVGSDIQTLTGTLTGDRVVQIGGSVGVWFVQNDTVGAFDLFLRAVDPVSDVSLPQGAFAVVAGTGASLYIVTSSAGVAYLPVTGGTMTGPLILFQDPVDPLEAVTKRYADAVATSASGAYTGELPPPGAVPGRLWWDSVGLQLFVLYDDGSSVQWVIANSLTMAGSYLPFTGGTMTGPLTLAGPPTAPNHAVTKAYTDAQDVLRLALSGGTMTGQIILPAGAPTNALQAITKAYVDALRVIVDRVVNRIFDPLDYGAVYDNVADDGPAIQRAIGAAQVNGGVVGIRAPGNPIRIGTGLINANGVKIVALAGRNFTSFSATPGGWGRYGVYFRPTDPTNAAIRCQGHGCEVLGINFIFDQPIPDVTFTPVVWPYAIDVYANYVTIQGCDIIAASHGLRIRYGGGVPNGSGGGTRVVVRDVTIDSYYVGLQTQNINDCIVLDGVSVRGVYYVTTPSVTAFRENNQIGWDCWCTENPWVTGMQFFQSKIGILLSNGTVLGNTHSLTAGLLHGVQFNLCRIAIATSAPDTIAQAILTNCNAQTDTETRTLDTLFQFYSNACRFTFAGLYGLSGGEMMRVKSGSVVTIDALRVYNWSASTAGQVCFGVEAGGTLRIGTRDVTKRSETAGKFLSGSGSIYTSNYAYWMPFSDFLQKTIALTGAIQNATNIDWPYTPIAAGAKQWRLSGAVNVSVAVTGTFDLFFSGFSEIDAPGIDCSTVGNKTFNTNWNDFLIATGNNQVGRPQVQGVAGASVQFGSVTLEFPLMPPFDFPDTPISGQIVHGPGGITYAYDGVKWLPSFNAGTNGLGIHVGDAPPPSPAPGNLWWDTTGLQLYVRYDDGSSVQWVIANSLDVSGSFLALSGGTMTGPIMLAGPPTAPLHPATKDYVDTRIPDVPVGMFGAQGNNSFDNTTAINSAIAVAGVTGGRVTFPGGDFRVLGTLAVTLNGVTLQGAGKRATRLIFANGAADCITVTGASVATQVYGFNLRDLMVQHTGKTGGATLKVTNASTTTVTSVLLDQTWNGIDLLNTNNVYLADVQIQGVTSGAGGFGIRWRGDMGTGGRSDVLTTIHVIVNCLNSGADAFLWDGKAHTWSGFMLTALQARRGMWIMNSLGISTGAGWPSFGEFSNFVTDGIYDVGLYCDAGSNMQFDLSQITCGPDGSRWAVYLGADVGGSYDNLIQFSNSRIGLSKQSAMQIAARNVQITACQIITGSFTPSNTYAAIHLLAPAQDIQIGGNSFLSWGASLTWSYGVEVDAGCFRVDTTDNTFYGAVSGNVLNHASADQVTYDDSRDRAGAPMGFYYDDAASYIRRNLPAAVHDFKVWNPVAGAGVASRLTLATGSPNSFLLMQLSDNSGAPFATLSGGAAVQYVDWNLKTFMTWLGVSASYANDAAAAAGGVGLRQLYRNGSQVMIRVT